MSLLHPWCLLTWWLGNTMLLSDHLLLCAPLYCATRRQKHAYATSDVLSTEGVVDRVERVHCKVGSIRLSAQTFSMPQRSATVAMNAAHLESWTPHAIHGLT